MGADGYPHINHYVLSRCGPFWWVVFLGLSVKLAEIGANLSLQRALGDLGDSPSGSLGMDGLAVVGPWQLCPFLFLTESLAIAL